MHISLSVVPTKLFSCSKNMSKTTTKFRAFTTWLHAFYPNLGLPGFPHDLRLLRWWYQGREHVAVGLYPHRSHDWKGGKVEDGDRGLSLVVEADPAPRGGLDGGGEVPVGVSRGRCDELPGDLEALLLREPFASGLTTELLGVCTITMTLRREVVLDIEGSNSIAEWNQAKRSNTETKAAHIFMMSCAFMCVFQHSESNQPLWKHCNGGQANGTKRWKNNNSKIMSVYNVLSPTVHASQFSLFVFFVSL